MCEGILLLTPPIDRFAIRGKLEELQLFHRLGVDPDGNLGPEIDMRNLAILERMIVISESTV